jgi:hypothetical protein
MKFLLLAAILATTCQTGPFPPQPNPDPVPFPPVDYDSGPAPVLDAGPQPDLDPGVRSACASIARSGCVEGGPSCGPVMQKALAERLTIVPLGCLTGAATKEAIRACGFVACR